MKIFQGLFVSWPLTFCLDHRKNLIRVDEVLDAMRKFGKVSDEEKLQRIADVLDEDHDGAIRVQDVLKVSSIHISKSMYISALIIVIGINSLKGVSASL